MRRTNGIPVAIAGWMLGAGLQACDPPPPPPTFPVTFTASSDPGRPLAGVQITANAGALGQTGPDGTLRVELTGPEGSPVQVGATCPAGFRSPVGLPTLTLRQVVSLDPATAGRGLQVGIQCPPTHRHGVIVVRAAGETAQANLPVMVAGREVARTDASGTAHVALDMEPGATFQVLLATAENPLLRPANPRRDFTFQDQDDYFVFDQRFEVEVPRRVVRRRPPPAPVAPQVVLPVRLGPVRR